MPILGVIASSLRTAADTGAMFPLQVITVGPTAVSDVTFTNIPSTYTHLQIRGIMKSTSSSTASDLYIQVNSDTGSNYARHGLYGDGSSVTAYATASNSRMEIALCVATSTSTNVFGATVIDLLDYANTNKYKTMRGLAGRDNNGSTTEGDVVFASSLWQNTNAISSIKIYPGVGSWSQYSQFALYAVKGA